RLDGGIAIRRLVVKEHEMLHSRELAQLDAHHVARMAPVLLDRDRLGERIHGVEDDEIGVSEKARDRVGLSAVLELVLGVGAVDDAAAADLEAQAVGVARMALELRRHAQPAYFRRAPRRDLDELDGRAEVVERHWEAGRRLLQPEGPLEDAVAAVDADARAAHVS